MIINLNIYDHLHMSNPAITVHILYIQRWASKVLLKVCKLQIFGRI